MKITYTPIGIIHSPFKHAKGTPIQSSVSQVKGQIEIFSEFQKGLKDIEGFSHIILLYHFHLSKPAQLIAHPFMDQAEHGIFSIRAPSRPNPIGFSIVKLNQVNSNILTIEGVDILDETPLLDIKPFVAKFDIRTNTKSGWLEPNIHKLQSTTDDGRFKANNPKPLGSDLKK